MFDYLKYTQVAGKNDRHDVEVYALSTCGFCKRALYFLNENHIAYRYVYVDLVSIDVKNQAKEALKAQFAEHVSFPYAVIDGKTTLVGFLELDWRKTLLDA
jgi:glutaredoxin